MDKLRNKVKEVLTVNKIIIIFSLVIFIWSYSWGIFDVTEENKVSVFGIVMVVWTAIISIYKTNINNANIKKREYDFFVLKEKQKIVTYFVDYFSRIIANMKDDNNSNPINDEIKELSEKFKKGLALWGSEELINKFLNYEENIGSVTADEVQTKSNNLLKLLRKEIGFDDSEELEVIKLFMKYQN